MNFLYSFLFAMVALQVSNAAPIREINAIHPVTGLENTDSETKSVAKEIRPIQDIRAGEVEQPAVSDDSVSPLL